MTRSPPPRRSAIRAWSRPRSGIGKRGKAGGIKIASNVDEARTHSEAILGMDIRGFTVHDLWIEGASDIANEYYASIILDRSEKKLLVLLSRMGGMDVEEIAETDPNAMVRATSSLARSSTLSWAASSPTRPGSTTTSSTASPRCFRASRRSPSPKTQR